MKPKAFVLYPNQWKALKELSLEGVGYLFSAVYRTLNGEDKENLEKSMSRDVLLAFRFLMIQIDIDYTKYLDKVEKNRERQTKYRQVKNENERNALNKEKEREKENEKEKEIENESENENERDDDVSVSGPPETSSSSQRISFESFKKAANDVTLPWINGVLDKYESKIPRLRRLNERRINRLYALYCEHGNKAIGEAIINAAKSPFLNGLGARHKFVANFDWIISEEHFLDVLEGTHNTSR